MKKLSLTLFLTLICGFSFAQKQAGSVPQVLKRAAFQIDSLPKEGILLDKGWKWHNGDNPDFAKTDFDDSAWESIDPTKSIKELKEINTEKPLWLRFKFYNQLHLKNLLLSINQSGATEIFINGKQVNKYGEIESENKATIAFDPLGESSILDINTAQNILAVRYFFQKDIEYNTLPTLTLPLFLATLSKESNSDVILNTIFWSGFNIAMAFMLFLIHFIYFLSYTPLKSNLWFSLSAFLWVVGDYLLHQKDITHSIDIKSTYSHYHFITDQLRVVFLFITMYLYLKQSQKWLPVSFVSISFLSIIFNYFFYFDNIWILNFCFVLMYGTFILYMGYNAHKRGIEGGKYVILGVIGYVIFWGLFIASFTFNWATISKDIFFHIAILIIPVTMSSLLGLNFKNANKQIIKNLEQINSLSLEKQQILSTQNETLEKQVKERTAELVASQNQLIHKEKLASLGELTAGIAHEIQNPLNFVNNFSELSVDLIKDLKEEFKKSEKDEVYIDELFDDLSQNQEKINHHGKRASSIVKGMLEHSRASTGVKELTDINKLADESLRLSYHGLRAKDKNFNSDFTTDFDENLPKINVIPQDFGRVLLNLMNNSFYAVKDVPHLEGVGHLGKVTVSTQQADNQIIIKVTDNGTGMSEATKAKIFQPFFTTKPTGQGTGLGLSLAYDIITKGHGGTIEVETKEGEGTTFIIKLPIINS